MHLIKLLGGVGHVESCFNLFGDVLSVNAGWEHGLRRMYHRLRKSCRMHPMVLLGYEAQLDACFGPFGGSANLDAR
jgi:hypothetical protein